jgi:3-oxoacyl-[acyl-carrier-protein] synthase II
MNAFITGIGWVTASGTGMGRNKDTFEMSEGALPRFEGKMPFANPKFRRAGRLDRFSKLGITAMAYALRDAGLDTWEQKRDIGAIVSTVFGCLATDIDYYKTVMVKNGILADPNLFTYTLPNSFLGYASLIFGLTGTNFVINDKTSSGIPALRPALDCITLGESGAMLAGICDVERPLDIPVFEKFLPGAVFVVIEKTIERQCRPYGRLSVDNNGNVLFNESKTDEIATCVRKCLNANDGI